MKEFLQENFEPISKIVILGLILFIVFFYSFIPPRHEFLGSTEADSFKIIENSMETLLMIKPAEFDKEMKLVIHEESIKRLEIRDSTSSYTLFISCGQQYFFANNMKELFKRYSEEEMTEILDCFYGISNAYLQKHRDAFIVYRGWK